MASKHTITIQSGQVGAGIVISIDAITKLSETFRGKATDNPTASRTSVTDHYIVDNPKYSFTGVVSGVFNPADSIITDSAITIGNLKSTIEGAKLVTFLSGSGSVKDCFVESLTLERTVKEGVLGWKVSCNLKKINIATGGTESVINIIPDQSAAQVNKSSSSTKSKGEVFQLQGSGVVLTDSQYDQKTYSYK